MGKNTSLRPGAKVPRSGQCEQTGPRGGKANEVTSMKGERLPPTPKKGMSYRLVDPTKNKAGAEIGQHSS